jgi:hypothetical protein
VQLGRPAEDRAADKVGLVPGELRWRRYRPGDDAARKPGANRSICCSTRSAKVSWSRLSHARISPRRRRHRGPAGAQAGRPMVMCALYRSSHPPAETCIVPAPAVWPADHGTGARRAQSSRRIPTLILERCKERNSKDLAHGRPTPRPRRCCVSRRGRAPAMQRGHTRRTASACRPDSGRMSSQSTWGYRASRDRLSASPQRVWLVPGIQAWTSPPGRRTPSGSTHPLDAATAYFMWPLCPIRSPGTVLELMPLVRGMESCRGLQGPVALTENGKMSRYRATIGWQGRVRRRSS